MIHFMNISENFPTRNEHRQRRLQLIWIFEQDYVHDVPFSLAAASNTKRNLLGLFDLLLQILAKTRILLRCSFALILRN